MQGFGAGAEIAGASVMLAEYASRKRRGIISSLVALGTNSGTLGAAAIWAVLLHFVGSDAVIAWGWRIPFLASIVVMGLAVYIRFHLKETPVFEATTEEIIAAYDQPLSAGSRDASKTPTRTAVQEEIAKTPRSIKAFLIASVLRFGQSGNSGMVQTYLITFLTANVLLAKSVTTNTVVYSSIVGFVSVPLIGWIGDHIGRKRMYTIVTLLGLVVIVPSFLLMLNNLGTDTIMEATANGNVAHYSNPTLLFFIGYIVLHNITVLSLFSLENITMAECFGSAHRYEQLALSKEIPNLITAGFGPLIAAALVTYFQSWIALAILMAFYTGSTLIASLVMPEIAGRDLTIREDAM